MDHSISRPAFGSEPENPAPAADTAAAAAGAEKPRIKMQLYKTEPCQNWTLYGTCRYGNLCKFAHGMTEQRSRLRHPKYKTSLCKDFPLGKCTFGVRCNFAHSLDELRMNMPASQAGTGTQAQAVIQTPVTMLPDGRMLSTFTPVTAATAAAAKGAGLSAAATAKAANAATLKSPVPLTATAARELKHNRSMGALRNTSTFGTPGLLPLTVSGGGPSQNNVGTAFTTQYACPSPKSLNNGQQQLLAPTAEFGKQPFHHLHHDRVNVTRRVASLSQLPTITSNSQMFSSTASVANPNYLQNIQLGGSIASNSGFSQAALLHSSPLAHVPIGNGSPALSSPSYSLREFDELPTPVLAQAEFETHASEWIQAPPALFQSQSQQQHQVSQQRKTLTSSISMQTLPRFNIQTNWEPAKTLPASSAVSSVSGSQSSIAGLHLSTSTLNDSTVWGSTSNGLTSTDFPVQSLESRFFPSNTGTNSAAFVDPLGIHYPAQQSQQSQQQLRHKQSIDDWASLASAYPSPVKGAQGYFFETTAPIGTAASTTATSTSTSTPLAVTAASVAAGLLSTESRLTSLEQLRAATSSRKQLGTMAYPSALCL